VERYPDDFRVVMMGLDDGYSTARIARLRERQASLLKKKPSGGGRDWADTGQRSVILELWTREEIQEKNELPFLGLELQVTIIRSAIRKILVA